MWPPLREVRASVRLYYHSSLWNRSAAEFGPCRPVFSSKTAPALSYTSAPIFASRDSRAPRPNARRLARRDADGATESSDWDLIFAPVDESGVGILCSASGDGISYCNSPKSLLISVRLIGLMLCIKHLLLLLYREVKQIFSRPFLL